MKRLLALSLLLATLLGLSCSPEFECTPIEEAQLYEKRIRPLFEEERPSSCNQCHLSGIDLKLWLRPTPCETMACMAQEGLVDLQNPEQSLVLSWIDRAKPESSLITAEVIAEEREGFLQWIRRTATCGGCLVEGDACGRSAELPDDTWTECESVEFNDGWITTEDPGDCSDKTLEMLFQKKIYHFRNRCYPCHHEIKVGQTVPDAPKWIYGGPCNSGSLASMRALLRKNWIDFDEPEKSRVLLKPLAESLGGLEHGGEDKFADFEDPGYVDMRYWIERYVDCKSP